MPTAAPLLLQFAELCETGDRAENQDALAHARHDNLACFVMSDGAGGHVGGEIASHLVVNAVIESFTQELSFSTRALQSYLDQAIAQVANGRRDARVADMSATVAVVLIDQDNACALWGHLGDTRIYFFRAGQPAQVTKDHSLVQQFVDAGYVQPEQARNHPQRSVLFAAIGPDGDNPPVVTPQAVGLTPGDAMLICTDGLWEWLSEQDMQYCLNDSDSAASWLAALQQMAADNSRSSVRQRDNFSAQAIWFLQPAARQES
ncbi:MAG: protein phosphatase 2C domain-containing protein [Pseudomonadota bacterium]|nr:protein phosphatase 2C domain-containing protein [Pseudomonadota bacterium]